LTEAQKWAFRVAVKSSQLIFGRVGRFVPAHAAVLELAARSAQD
jgi:hypothetical protein